MRHGFAFIIGVVVAATVLFSVKPVFAQKNAPVAQDTLYKAQVEQILDTGSVTAYGLTNPYQTVRVKIVSGDLNGTEITIDHGKGYNIDKSQFVRVNGVVVVTKIIGDSGAPQFQIVDTYRLTSLTWLVVGFFIAIIVLSGWKGLGSIVGMVVSLGVIGGYIVPQILSGHDALTASIIGSLIIMVLTIYLAHGFSRKTTIALVSTFITLVFTGIISTLFVRLLGLNGLGSEDAYSLKLGPTATINFRGLLLGGILIGTLGVLDDVTTGLAASVFELAKANPSLKFLELYRSGLTIGREHIASLVNTLVLAYAGTSLPVFLTLVINPSGYPLWAVINSEMIVEEVVRTLAGSLGLVAAVPLTTLIAAWYVSVRKAS